MERAKIYVLDKRGKKNESLEVMFNPEEYSNTINVKWSEGKNKKLQFNGSNFENFTITLFFDSYEQGNDVREDHELTENGRVRKAVGTKRILELGFPSDEGQECKTPPVCLFSWGKFNFKGVIEQVKQNFIMFLSDGTPVRAKVTIVMKPVMSSQDMLKMQGVEACRKIRIVMEGERLDIIAAEELKDPLLWRKIAEENNIDDPLNFPGPQDIGRTIIIPDLEV